MSRGAGGSNSGDIGKHEGGDCSTNEAGGSPERTARTKAAGMATGSFAAAPPPPICE